MGKRPAEDELFVGNMGSIQREIRTSMQREDKPTMETGLERIAAKARSEPKLRFTSLAHHITRERVWTNLCQIPKRSAPGVDGHTATVQGFGYRPVDDLSASADGRCPKAFREGTRGGRGWRSAIYGDLPGQRLGSGLHWPSEWATDRRSGSGFCRRAGRWRGVFGMIEGVARARGGPGQ